MNPNDAQPMDTPIEVFSRGDGFYTLADGNIRDELVVEIDDDSTLMEALQYQDAVEEETARRLQAAYNWVKDVPMLVLETTTLEEFVRMMQGVFEKGVPHATQ